MKYKTEQESFWAGKFGDDYVERNSAPELTTRRIGVFARILEHTRGVKSIIEFGPNVGHNLRALKTLLPKAQLSAIEINDKAVSKLGDLGLDRLYHCSLLDFTPDYPRDFVLISGVLIHIAPSSLPVVYEKLVRSSSRYLCVDEYYNPTPVEVPYRGERERLFKRDFAGEILDRFPEFSLIAYGFVYHRDPNFPTDDSTWFLLEKGR
jgi:pseudaminic acid biosynthesis-associated methylase